MKRMMVRYKVKPDRAAENERYIAAVFAQLRERQPAGLRYASFKLDDGVSFVHIVSHESADGSNPLSELPAFKTFVAGIRERCAEAPVAVDLIEVDAYRSFGVEQTLAGNDWRWDGATELVFVTLRYADDFDERAVRKIAETVRAKFEGMPGLRSKAFTLNSGKREAMNFYIWESEDAAKAFFTNELLAGGAEPEALTRRMS